MPVNHTRTPVFEIARARAFEEEQERLKVLEKRPDCQIEFVVNGMHPRVARSVLYNAIAFSLPELWATVCRSVEHCCLEKKHKSLQSCSLVPVY